MTDRPQIRGHKSQTKFRRSRRDKHARQAVTARSSNNCMSANDCTCDFATGPTYPNDFRSMSPKDYVALNGDRTVSRGSLFKLLVNCCRTNTRKNFFSERVEKVWNSLPPSIVTFSSLAMFRNSLNRIGLRIYTKY